MMKQRSHFIIMQDKPSKMKTLTKEESNNPKVKQHIINQYLNQIDIKFVKSADVEQNCQEQLVLKTQFLGRLQNLKHNGKMMQTMVRIVSWLEKYIDKVYVNDDNKCQEENDRNK